MNEEDAPRILVEGGVVHRRVNRTLAVLVGVVVGGLLGIGGTAVLSLKAIHDVQQSRRDNCHASNERHREAKAGIEVLAAHTPRAATQTRQERQIEIDALVNAFAPEYDCRTLAVKP